MAASWIAEKEHNHPDRWICIYPLYINSKKTLAQGRKIAKDKCVENPTYQEMRHLLMAHNFVVIVEEKVHPRERSKEWPFYGRLRVNLKNSDGTPANPKFPTRKSMLEYLGTSIPKLQTRQGKPATGQQPQQASTSTSSSSKKGKRKERK